MAKKVEDLWDTDPDFPSSEEWKDFTSNAVRSTDNVWYLNPVLSEYDLTNPGVPKLYRWVTEDLFRKRQTKEGQTIQETAALRVAQYQTTERKVIIDIIVDTVFAEPGADQKFHAFREGFQGEDIIWLRDEKASDEIIFYRTLEKFYAGDSIVRNALQAWTTRSDAGRINLDIRVPSLLMLISYFGGNRKQRRAMGKLSVFELCARFGKTIWSLALFQLSGHHTMIFGAYYLSSFGSIKNEVAKFLQFSNMQTVDTRNPNWQDDYRTYIEQGYKVIVLCSLQATDESWTKVENFYDENEVGLVILDEVDFGVHTDRSSERVAYIIRNSETVAMSGTNADRMNNEHFSICRFESYTMEQMLELKHALVQDSSIAYKAMQNLKNVVGDAWLKNVVVRERLDELPEMSFYQRTVEGDTNMTYQKLVNDVYQHEAILRRDSLIHAGADEEFPQLALNNVIQKANLELRKMRKTAEHELLDVIEFVPYNTGVANGAIDAYGEIRQKAFNSVSFAYKVVVVHGEKKHVANREGLYNRGQSVKIENAEHYVKDVKAQALEEGYKGVWIIASSMAQRSFSIGSISVIMLSFDKGDAGGVNQRLSRGSTPFDGKTASLIISNSFAKERDDKIVMTLQKMAKARAARTGEDFYTAIREVKLATSMFRIGADGRSIQYDIDEYLADLALNKSGVEYNIARSLTKQIIASNLIDAFKQGRKGARNRWQVKLDKTFFDDENENKRNTGDRQNKNEVSPVLAVVQNLINNAHLIDSLGQPSSNRVGFVKSVHNICIDEEKKTSFETEFLIDPNIFYAILKEQKDIELDIETHLSLCLQEQKNEAQTIYTKGW
jgi:hypothetical protein